MTDESERARALFERALARDPSDAATRYRYGRLLVSAFGERSAANEQFERVLETAPDHPGARNALAVRTLRAASGSPARDRLAAVLADHPTDVDAGRGPDVGSGRARMLARAQTNHASLRWRVDDDPGAAREGFERALSLAPEFAVAHCWLARLYAGAFDDPERARERYERALVAAPDRVQTHVDLGNLHWRAFDDPERARERYEHAVSLDPESALAQYNLGTLRFDAFDDPEGARTAFERALAADPDNREAQIALVALGSEES